MKRSLSTDTECWRFKPINVKKITANKTIRFCTFQNPRRQRGERERERERERGEREREVREREEREREREVRERER